MPIYSPEWFQLQGRKELLSGQRDRYVKRAKVMGGITLGSIVAETVAAVTLPHLVGMTFPRTSPEWPLVLGLGLTAAFAPISILGFGTGSLVNVIGAYNRSEELKKISLQQQALW